MTESAKTTDDEQKRYEVEKARLAQLDDALIERRNALYRAQDETLENASIAWKWVEDPELLRRNYRSMDAQRDDIDAQLRLARSHISSQLNQLETDHRRAVIDAQANARRTNE